MMFYVDEWTWKTMNCSWYNLKLKSMHIANHARMYNSASLPTMYQLCPTLSNSGQLCSNCVSTVQTNTVGQSWYIVVLFFYTVGTELDKVGTALVKTWQKNLFYSLQNQTEKSYYFIKAKLMHKISLVFNKNIKLNC